MKRAVILSILSFMIFKASYSQEGIKANLDNELVISLDTIYKDDQDLRQGLADVEEKYSRDSKEMKSYFKRIAKNDSINIIKVQKILDHRRWLGEDVIGKRGNLTLFLVIQHSDLKIQQKYLPMMREAVAKGNARGSRLALLEDRV